MRIIECLSVEGMDRLIRRHTAPVGSILDVGCGIRPQNPCCADYWVGLDAHLPYLQADHLRTHARCQADASKGLPFRTDAVDVVLASDLIEHLDRPDAWWLLAEAHRVARQGVLIRTPLGFQEQTGDAWGLDGDHWQRHRSGWQPGDLAFSGAVCWLIPPDPDDPNEWFHQGWFAVWQPVEAQ